MRRAREPRLTCRRRRLSQTRDTQSASRLANLERAQLSCRASVLHLKKIGASPTVNNACIFPNTDAIPAPVRPGLKNIAPKVSVVAVKASARIPRHITRGGIKGSPRKPNTPNKTTPAINARNPANVRGGANCKPAFISTKHSA